MRAHTHTHTRTRTHHLPQWVYSEDQLWDALNVGNLTITLASHIQFSVGGKWHTSPPPTVLGEVHVISMVRGGRGGGGVWKGGDIT